MMFKLFKRKKSIDLIDFSIQHVSTGKIKKMIDHLTDNVDSNFKYINQYYTRNQNGDLRCYLTLDYHNGIIVQWFSDRTPAQVEEFAQTFID